MLRGPEITQAEIALELGFADQSHFSRVFHRLTGMTPKAWQTIAAVSKSSDIGVAALQDERQSGFNEVAGRKLDFKD